MAYNAPCICANEQDLQEQGGSIICKVCKQIFTARDYTIHLSQICFSNANNDSESLRKLATYRVMDNMQRKNDTVEPNSAITENWTDSKNGAFFLPSMIPNSSAFANATSLRSQQEFTKSKQLINRTKRVKKCAKDKPFSCELCGKSFKYESSVIAHRPIHSVEKSSYPCEQCGKTYLSSYKLSKHQQLVHDNEPRSCTVCGKACKCASNLKLHMAKHTDEKPFSCQDCGTRFKRQTSLNAHIDTVHSTLYRHVCEKCGKAFKMKGRLTEHQSVHAEERAYICEMCGTGIKHKRNIQPHMQKHKDEKPCSYAACQNEASADGHMSQVHDGDYNQGDAVKDVNVFLHTANHNPMY